MAEQLLQILLFVLTCSWVAGHRSQVAGQLLSPLGMLLSDTQNGAYDITTLWNHDDETFDLRLRQQPAPMLASISWRINVSATTSFAVPQVIEIWPQNKTEFVHILNKIAELLENVIDPWLSWRPLFFVGWPQNSNDSDLVDFSVTKLRNCIDEVKGRFSADSDVYIFFQNTTTGYLEVFELYSLAKERIFQKLEFGELEITVFSNFLRKAVRRQNLQQSVIRPSAVDHLNYGRQVTFKRQLNGQLELGSGVCLMVFKALQFSLNFTTKAVVGRGKIYQEANGSWTGLAAQLRNDEVDITLNLATFLTYRLRGIDYLHPLTRISVQAFFKNPQASTIRNILINPLSPNTWLAMLGMWSLVVTSMTLEHFLRVHWMGESRYDSELVESSLLWVLSTFCQQGWYFFPRSPALKVIFLSTSVFGYVIYVAFSAALIPILTMETTPIKNKAQLGASGFTVIGDVDLPHVETYVKELESLGARTNEKLEKMGVEEAMPLVVRGAVAFVGFEDGFMTVFERVGGSTLHFCQEFYSLPVAEPDTVGFCVKKGSPYKELFNHKILLMQERGVTDRSMRMYHIQTSPQCILKIKNRGGEALEFLDVFTAFVVLLCGTLAALFFLLVEHILEQVKLRIIRSSLGYYLN